MTYRTIFDLPKCPQCNCDMKHLGFSWYQCMLLPRAFNHQPRVNVETFDPKYFNPKCLLSVKIN